MPILDEQEAMLLAGARGYRLARTPAEMDRELARGFRPSAVVVDAGSDAARGSTLAKRVARHPACSDVPILMVSGDEERLRLTLMNDAGSILTDPSRLGELLGILEELCFELEDGGLLQTGHADERQVAGRIADRFMEVAAAFQPS